MTRVKSGKLTLAAFSCAAAGLVFTALPIDMAAAAPSKRKSAPVRVSSAPSSIAAGTLILSVGESRVVNVAARMSDVIIANPNVVDVHVRSQNQLYILAKAPGESAITVTDKAGHTLYSARARVGNNLTSVDQMLKLAMPDANILVSNMNGMTLLTGTIKQPEDAAEAERLTQAYVGKDVTVVSRLRTATPLQVNLQVKISEVKRNLLHKIGTNITALGTGSGSFSGYIGRSTRNFATDGGYVPGPSGDITRKWTFNQPTDSSTTLGFIAKMFGADVAGALDLAENSGLATTLAQPNLTALSGETASFLAGGEYPYLIDNGTNQAKTFEFKQYGVQLAFTPTVLSDGRVSLRVRPSVSSLDFTINSSIPALKTRSAETTVELGSGQAFMIAGLLNNDTLNNVEKVPGIGNIPILGSLFKSRAFQRNETELVIVVTPYLVKPVNAGDIHLPTDGFRNANELQGLLGQQGHDGKSGVRDPMPTIAPEANSGTMPLDPATAPITPQASTQPTPERRDKRARRAEAASNSATPGFSF